MNLKLNRNKVELKQTQITYLGHIISSDGLRTDPKNIDAVKQIPPLVDKAGVQRLLGMVAYLQKFAPNTSNIAAPLRELVKKEVNFRWDEHCHGDALRKVKEALSEPPVLRYFDTKEETTLRCDASEKGHDAERPANTVRFKSFGRDRTKLRSNKERDVIHRVWAEPS